MPLKKLIFIATIFLSLNANASSSTEIMMVADGINSLQAATENLRKNSQDKTARRMWADINDLLRLIAISYRISAIEYSVVESNSKVDLKKFRFGNKLANKNNLEEAHSDFLLAWLQTDAAIKYINSLEKLVDDDIETLKLLKNRLESTTAPLQSHANQVLEYAQKK